RLPPSYVGPRPFHSDQPLVEQYAERDSGAQRQRRAGVAGGLAHRLRLRSRTLASDASRVAPSGPNDTHTSACAATTRRAFGPFAAMTGGRRGCWMRRWHQRRPIQTVVRSVVAKLSLPQQAVDHLHCLALSTQARAVLVG